MSMLSMFPALEPATQGGFAFPQSLTERYRPRRIEDFIGLEKVKKALLGVAADRQLRNFIFHGPSGLGKTTMAVAFADKIGAQITHIASQDCTVDKVERVCYACNYIPMSGKQLHLVLVDEADQMSHAAQIAFLSRLDGTNPPPMTMFIFTCNDVDRFEPRFRSRCFQLAFSKNAMAKQIAEFLEGVWYDEADPESTPPNFAQIAENSQNNVRAALMALDVELLTR